MTVTDLMTSNPACCTMDTPLPEIARMMVQYDCGEIPVVERQDEKKPVGVVTDRDIVTRAVAEGRDPAVMSAGDVMSSPAVCVQETDDVATVKELMESRQIRRIPVVDRNGTICGIIALADIALRDSRKETGEIVREVSTPTR
jgi:CBS domain-containing protein